MTSNFKPKLLLATNSLLVCFSFAFSSSALAQKENTAAFYTKEQLSQSFNACTNLFPNRSTEFTKIFNDQWRPAALCSNNFAVYYSKLSKTPLVVVEKLNAAILRDAKGEERTENFYPDPRLKREDSASLADYRGSGFDRGHQSPAGNAPDQISMNQTFALSNMIPQDPTHNRKVWNKLEQDVRKYVLRASGNVFVYTGPLFNDRPVKTIGKGGVWVPSHVYKLVYDESSGRAWGWVLENTANAKATRPYDYAQFVSRTGLKLINPALVKGGVAN